METVDLVWLLAFAIQLVLGNVSYKLISISLMNKPLVEQSIYDQGLVDSFLVNNIYESWICVVVIASRDQYDKTF